MKKLTINGESCFVNSVEYGVLLSSGSWQIVRKGETDGIVFMGIGYPYGDFTLEDVDEAEMMNIVKADIKETTEVTDIAFVVLAESGTIDDVTASEHAYIFSEWQPDQDYTVGQLRRYGDTLYRCLTAHTAQEGWTPDVSPSLWVRTNNPADEWPEWSQPIGATDAYAMGDKVSHNGKHWVSSVNGNTWEPGMYGWDEATE